MKECNQQPGMCLTQGPKGNSYFFRTLFPLFCGFFPRSKERKGKERKGKERKGKEGKERKGTKGRKEGRKEGFCGLWLLWLLASVAFCLAASLALGFCGFWLL